MTSASKVTSIQPQGVLTIGAPCWLPQAGHRLFPGYVVGSPSQAGGHSLLPQEVSRESPWPPTAQCPFSPHVMSVSGSLITGIIALLHPNYIVERWHVFLIFEAWMIGSFLINTFGVRLLPTINRAALTWSITGVVVISITCLACASPRYESAQFVFRTYINETGWNNGVAWVLGLLQSAFGLTGFDA